MDMTCRMTFLLGIFFKASIIISFFLTLTCFGQELRTKKVSPSSLKVKEEFYQVKNNPKNLEIQKKYLELFPKDYSTFSKIFDPEDFSELYDSSYEYIFILDSISKNYPHEVGIKIIHIAKDGEEYLKRTAFISDATSYLQDLTIRYANNFPEVFIREINHLNISEVNSLIAFLADVENHSVYNEYENFITILKLNKQSTLLNKFVVAKKERMKYRHHGE